MRILMVAPQPFFRPRGTPFSVLHRIRGLAMLGHTVELVTYPFGESPSVSGLTIHRAVRPPMIRDVAIGPSVGKVILDIPLFRLASKLARSGRFDFIHTHEEAGWLGARLRRSMGLPHLYDMHSSLPQQLLNFGRFQPAVSLFKHLEGYTLGGSDAVIAICQDLADHARTSGYTGPLAMIENTLDFPVPPVSDDVLAELRARLDLGDGRVVVYTGTLEPYQGMNLLLDASAAVLQRLPPTRFVVVGGTAEQVANLRQHATRAGVAHAFRWVPPVPPDEVPRYLQLADVLVTPRVRGTNTPLKIYQYLRAGRPIVATSIRAHTQVLDHTLAELVAPEPGPMAAGLVRVLTEAPYARRLGEAAAAAAQERYGDRQYLDRLEGLLRRMALRSA
ncbi:MAG TPA: glycosyltransferase family 4 protein [Gemmatimonadaceae bacterium]